MLKKKEKDLVLKCVYRTYVISPLGGGFDALQNMETYKDMNTQ